MRCEICQQAVLAVLLVGTLSVPGDAEARSAGAAAEFLTLHPENPHYFLWRGEPTVLVTSGEHYGALLNLDFDYIAYLDELQRHGLNHTRTFSGVYREQADSFRITENTLAPRPHRYICPWPRSDQPGYAGGGNRFDLSRWNDAYFSRLKDFLRAADQRGIVVELTLFCPMYRDPMWDESPMNARNNVNGIGNCAREEVYTLGQTKLNNAQFRLARKIVRELRDFGNLYYEVCNEPYFGGVTMDWQHAIVDTIVEAEKESPNKHLISMNIANGEKKVVDPHPGVSIFNFHYCVPPRTVAMNYGLNKVIGENETGFRGSADVLYRTEAWDFLMAGGGLYNNLDYSFTASHPQGTREDYDSPGGGSVALRKQLGVLKRFMDDIGFVRMQPDANLVRQASEDLTWYALSAEDGACAIYLHVPLPKKVEDLDKLLRHGIQTEIILDLPAAMDKSRYAFEWIDTKSGQVTPARRRGNAFFSPKFDNDIAFRIRRESGS